MSQEALETVDTEVCKLKHLVEEQQLTITEYKHLLSVTEKRITKLLVNNQQLMESLTKVEVRLGHVNYWKWCIKVPVFCWSWLEQQLEERQSQIKELWKQNCDLEIQEFDLIICERSKELESLKKELEAKNMMVELHTYQGWN